MRVFLNPDTELVGSDNVKLTPVIESTVLPGFKQPMEALMSTLLTSLRHNFELS